MVLSSVEISLDMFRLVPDGNTRQSLNRIA